MRRVGGGGKGKALVGSGEGEERRGGGEGSMVKRSKKEREM